MQMWCLFIVKVCSSARQESIVAVNNLNDVFLGAIKINTEDQLFLDEIWLA